MENRWDIEDFAPEPLTVPLAARTNNSTGWSNVAEQNNYRVYKYDISIHSVSWRSTDLGYGYRRDALIKNLMLAALLFSGSSIAQASVVPTSGASFVTIDSSLLGTSAYNSLENPTSLMTPYGLVTVSGDGNADMLSMPDGVAFWGDGYLRLGFNNFPFHQMFFEFTTSNDLWDLVIAGVSGILNIPDSAGLPNTYYLDIYSPTPLSNFIFSCLQCAAFETDFTTGTVFFSNSDTPLYGDHFTQLSPIPEPTSGAMLSGALIAVLLARRKINS